MKKFILYGLILMILSFCGGIFMAALLAFTAPYLTQKEIIIIAALIIFITGLFPCGMIFLIKHDARRIVKKPINPFLAPNRKKAPKYEN